MMKTYLIGEDQHDALIRAARHGKDHMALTDLERCMCSCAEIDLTKATKALHHQKRVFVLFYDAEVKIPALEKAHSLFVVDNSFDDLLMLCARNFPDFGQATEVKSECGPYYALKEINKRN